MYTDKVMDHFLHPRNAGNLPDANSWGEIGNQDDGDMMRLMLKIEADVITAKRFKTFGCAAAIATSSTLTEMAIGKNLDEALTISKALTLTSEMPDGGGANASLSL